MSLNKVAIGLSTAFWLVTMVLLFRLDVLPNYQLADNPGYDALVRTVDVPVVREMAVFKDGVEVGTTTTSITPEADGKYRIVNATIIDVQMGIFQSKVQALFELLLDENQDIEEVFLRVDMAGQRADVVGRRDGDVIKLRITLGEEAFEESIPYDSAMFSSYFDPFAMGARLKVGQSWRTKFMDPLAQKVTVAEVRVVGREAIEISLAKGAPPQTVDAYKVVMDWGTGELRAWATADGVVLKQETPLGYTLIYRESAEDDKSTTRSEVLRREMRGSEPESEG